MNEISELKDAIKSLMEKVSKVDELVWLKEKVAGIEKTQENLNKLVEASASLASKLEETERKMGMVEESQKKFRKEIEDLKAVKLDLLTKMEEVITTLKGYAEKLEGVADEVKELDNKIAGKVKEEVERKIEAEKESIAKTYENILDVSKKVETLEKSLVSRIDETATILDEKMHEINSSFLAFKEEVEEGLTKRGEKIEATLSSKLDAKLEESVKKMGEKIGRIGGIVVDLDKLRKDVLALKNLPRRLAELESSLKSIKLPDQRQIEAIVEEKLAGEKKSLVEEISKSKELFEAFVERVDSVAKEFDEKIAKVNSSFLAFKEEVRGDLGERTKGMRAELNSILKENSERIKKSLENLSNELEKNLNKRTEKYFSTTSARLSKNLNRLIRKPIARLNKRVDSLNQLFLGQLDGIVKEYEKRFEIIREEVKKIASQRVERLGRMFDEVVSDQNQKVEKVEKKIREFEQELKKTGEEIGKLREDFQTLRKDLIFQL